MLRGEEERGSMDVLLSMPRGRGARSAGEAGRDLDSSVGDGPIDRAIDLCWWHECECGF